MVSVADRAPRVLVADDDPLIRDALSLLLAAEGFEMVGWAADGREAVAKARELAPDVVLVDVRMPHLGGIEAGRLIRDALKDTQIIVLTAYDDPALAELAGSTDTYAYLVKGCPPSQILDTVWRAGRRVSETRGCVI